MEEMQGGSAIAQVPLAAVVASSPSGVIGINGALPWKLSTDLQRFKTMTMGGTLIMGRKTFDSIGRVLPGRQTIVLTRQAEWSPKELPGKELTGADRLQVATTPDEAILIANRLALPAYVVGGAEIYQLLLPYCQELRLTRVETEVEGDTRIDLPLEQFELAESTAYPASERDSAPSIFQIWKRQTG